MREITNSTFFFFFLFFCHRVSLRSATNSRILKIVNYNARRFRRLRQVRLASQTGWCWYLLPSALQSKVSGLIGMMKTCVVRMLSAATKTADADNSITFGCMIVAS